MNRAKIMEYPRNNSAASMPSSYNEIKVRMGFGSDIDPKEYQRRKYEFVFSPASIAMPIKRKYIRNFIANWLDGLSSS